jgi:hypothetical protein
MPGCAAAQLVVDPPRLMALCADHMQPAQLCAGAAGVNRQQARKLFMREGQLQQQ